MTNTICIISRPLVEQHLPYDVAIDAVAKAMVALSSGQIALPLRSFTPISDAGGQLAIMPAAAEALPVLGLKSISILPNNPVHDRPAIQGHITLFDSETGAPCALIEGSSVTGIRTAAASALATRELARDGAATHGILGTGVQAKTHAHAIIAACAHIEQTVIWGRDLAKAEALAATLDKQLDCAVSAASLEQVCSADIISAVTGSRDPLIELEAVHPGAHLNLVGSHSPDRREVSTALMHAAKLFVDSRDAALSEAGDIMLPIEEAAIGPDHILAEIGEVIAGGAAFERRPTDITIYKSLGNAGQDLFVGHALLKTAQKHGVGQLVQI